MNPKKTPLFIPQLNGLRALAALNVIVAHYSNQTHLWNNILGDGAGQMGVMLFFILSAFLMCHLYWEPAANPMRFLQNRFARIYPLVAFTILFSYLAGITHLPYNMFAIHADNVLQHLCLNQTNSILWTIKPEVIFYGAFAIFLLLPRHLAKIAMALFILVGLIAFSGLNLFAYFSHAEVFKFFALGSLLYFMQPYLQLRISQKWLDNLLSVLLFGSFFAIYPRIYAVIFNAQLVNGGWDSIAPPLFLSLLLLGALHCSGLKKLFAQSILVYIGEISFSMYLLHLFILRGMKLHGLLQPHAMNLVIFILLVIGVSSLSFYAIERPLRHLLRSKRESPLLFNKSKFTPIQNAR